MLEPNCEDVEQNKEGVLDKPIFLSMGSIAQLKHPRKFWPKVYKKANDKTRHMLRIYKNMMEQRREYQ